MVRKSRFLKKSSGPSSGSLYDSDLGFSRSTRASSAIPPRDYRAGSAAPMRASSLAPGRASSVAPFRSTSVAPMRASSVVPSRSSASIRASSMAPMRASSVAPYRASSVAPYRSSSVAPYRSSSVAPYRSSSVAPYRSPSYSQSTVKGTLIDPFSYKLQRSSSVPPKSVSFRSTPLVSHIDTSIPTRQFGTRLGIQKMETSVKPAIYDEYYGTTYVPSGGRDSWSAYRISDETLDDNDDLVYESAKKDHEVMKKVNKQIQQVDALSLPAPVFIPLAPAYRRFTPQQPPQIVPVPIVPEVNKDIYYKPAPRLQPGVYRAPPPVAKVRYTSVYDSDELMRPKNKSVANEPLDLSQPAAFSKLKERLRGARENMDRSKKSLNTYSGDPDLRAINAEVQAIRSAREMRAQSLNKLK